MIDGLRLALTTFTVAPLRAGRVDRRAAAAAIGLAPLLGVLLGGLAAGAALALYALGAPALLAAVAAVAATTLLTRALHLDGLADTLDALGSYRDRERALAIMKQPDIGPFGVIGIVLALLAQVAAVAALLPRGWLAALVGISLAAGTGRLAVAYACRRGVPAARPEGLGALVAGTVTWPVVLLWCAALAGLGLAAVPGRPWHGPLALLAGLAAAALLTRHAARRLGGVTGDVLGAVLEIAATVALVGLALG